MPQSYVREDLDAFVAHLPEVKRALMKEARIRTDAARAQASLHRRTGRFLRSIKVTQGKVDAWIEFNDLNSANKNWDHFDRKLGRWVRGVHAIEAAKFGWSSWLPR